LNVKYIWVEGRRRSGGERGAYEVQDIGIEKTIGYGQTKRER
jgi:hypothetical protein